MYAVLRYIGPYHNMIRLYYIIFHTIIPQMLIGLATWSVKGRSYKFFTDTSFDIHWFFFSFIYLRSGMVFKDKMNNDEFVKDYVIDF